MSENLQQILSLKNHQRSKSLKNYNDHFLKSLLNYQLLLFQTDLPPFPFTDIDGESSKDEVIVDSEVEEENAVEETAAEDKEQTN